MFVSNCQLKNDWFGFKFLCSLVEYLENFLIDEDDITYLLFCLIHF